MTPTQLTDVEAGVLDRWLSTCCDWLERPYPYVLQGLLRSAEDLRPPSAQHPSFGTGYDWHSAVHFHWSACRLLRVADDLPGARRAREILARSLRPDHLAVEAAYLADHPLFERPYGWGWALLLAAEVRRHPVAGVDPTGFDPLVDTVDRLLRDYLDGLPFPERAGLHRNTAFALTLTRHAAGRLERDDLAALADATARRLFTADVAAPVAYEPGPADFLSPTLMEAHLMVEVLSGPDAPAWLMAFLPTLVEDGALPARLARPVGTGGVEGDALAAHLRGLNLSRAWNLAVIAAAVPEPAVILEARAGHLDVALAEVITGDAGSDHWLVSFALLALGALEA